MREKWELHTEQKYFLGFVITIDKIQENQKKTAAMQVFERPATRQSLQYFLSFLNFNLMFIEKYRKRYCLMFKLLRKTAKQFKWTEHINTAFNISKKGLKSNTILKYFDKTLKTIIESHVLDMVTCTTLSK